MTCIVAHIDKENNNVVMVGDSAGVAGLDVTIRKDPKVFINKGFKIGCTSSFRMIQILRFSFTPPPIDGKEMYAYMCTDFVNAVRDCFKTFGYAQKWTDGDEKGGTFLVSHGNRLFKIDNDFQVSERFDEYESVGCGSVYALASFYNQDLNKTPYDKCIKAIETAEYFSGGVIRPFVSV